MILLHCVKMSLTIERGEQLQVNEDVTFYMQSSAYEAIEGLVELQDLNKQLRREFDPIEKFHLLHVTEIHTPLFKSLSHNLCSLNGLDLEWQVANAKAKLESLEMWNV